LKDIHSCDSLYICKFSFSKLHEIIIWISSKCWIPKTKFINNVESYYSPHFIIIRTLVVDHTYIGLCKYWDIHIIVVKFPQRPPISAFCDIFLRYYSFVEACPLCKSCRNFGYNSSCLHHIAKGVCICKKYLKWITVLTHKELKVSKNL